MFWTPNCGRYTRNNLKCARSWKPRHIIWLSGFDFQWSLRYRKAIHKMGIAFANNRLLTHSIPKKCPAFFNGNPDKLSHRVITVDEKWIHHNTLESKQQSIQWVFLRQISIKVGQYGSFSQQNHGEGFWDAQVIIHIDLLQPTYLTGTTTFWRKNESISSKWKFSSSKTTLGCPRSVIVMTQFNEFRSELLPYPPYFPDLAPPVTIS